MARECCQCEYHRNTVWYVEDMEMATDLCTLGCLFEADDCPHFEELDYRYIDYEQTNTRLDNLGGVHNPVHPDTDKDK